MLGYVSTERLTCLLLELAQTNLTSALQQMKDGVVDDNCIRYLNDIAMQIVNGMVSTVFEI